MLFGAKILLLPLRFKLVTAVSTTALAVNLVFLLVFFSGLRGNYVSKTCFVIQLQLILYLT